MPVSWNHTHERIHPFPPEICLAASSPSVLAANPLQNHPSWGETEILARSLAAKGRGASSIHLSLLWSVLHLADPGLRRPEKETRIPSGDTLVQKTIPARGSRLEKCYLGILVPKGPTGRATRPQKSSEVLRPEDPQILRDSVEGCPDAKQNLMASGRLQTLRPHGGDRKSVV